MRKTHVAKQTKGNRLAFQGDRHFTYDSRRNLIKEARGKNGKLVTSFTYSGRNQLIEIDNCGTKIQYQYDALGRKTKKISADTETQFLWNGDVLLSETHRLKTVEKDESANTEKTTTAKIYVFEPNSFKPLAQIQNNEIYHYHLDHLGTPQELTTNDGSIVWSAQYKTYGNLALKEVDEVENNLRFQGQYFDQETGLHYNRHRYNNPNTGQFTQQDPIGLLGGLNNYQYVPNPVGWVDPFGLSCKELLVESILDDRNLPGKGHYQEAYIIDDGRVFLTTKTEVTHGAPQTIEDLKHEAYLLGFLESQHDLPVMKVFAIGEIKKSDGNIIEGIIVERSYFNGKDFYSNIRRRNNPQGITLADVYDAVNESTLESLKKMKATIEKDRVVIKDFQLMYGKDGKPVIADPLDAYSGKYSDEDGVSATLATLQQNIDMVENILKKKST